MRPPGLSPWHFGVLHPHSYSRAQSANQTHSSSYVLRSAGDVLSLKPLPMVIKVVLQQEGVAAIYGASGSGKSFLAINAAVAIASGLLWFGFRVRQTPVVYVAMEGEAGLRNRVEAITTTTGQTMPTDLHFIFGQSFDLTVESNVQALADAIAAKIPAGGAVIFIDTLNRAAPGADENASADMGRILNGTKTLQRLTGGMVVLVHHTGKDASRGLRGHSSLHAALDAAIEVTRDGDRREWKLAKSKDGADGISRAFTLEIVTLGLDVDGDPITSCVVKPDLTISTPKPKVPQGGNQKMVWDALRPLFATGQVGVTGAPPTALCIDLEAAVTAGAPKLSCDPSKRRDRARAAITGMVKSGFLGLHGGWLWEI